MERDYPLKNFNTMGFDVIARYFCEINSLDDLYELIHNEIFINSKKLIMSGGSNILFQNEYYDGLVLFSNIKGIAILKDDDDTVLIRCQGGEIWKDFVDFTVDRGFHGLENLSDIPGKTGAAPIQNIGAYGAEVKNTIYKVHTIDLNSGDKRIFSNEECRFDYRNSIFKKQEYKNYFIYAIDFKLKKNADLQLDYGNIRDFLKRNNIDNPTINDVANCIKSIRETKLPKVGEIGSAGSFFKNPIVDKETYLEIKKQYPEIPSYPMGERFKIAAGWLIDKAGWKGYRKNHVGVWDKQALILVHYGGGTAQEILNLMKKIQKDLKEKFNIDIKPEVNII